MMIGKTISHYRIIEKLGEGGMGVIYKAEDTKLKRIVALKFLPPDLTRDPEAKERFIHEAQAASALDHQNICTIHEIDETEDDQTFIAMACYEGKILTDKIQKGPLKIDEAIDIAIQISQGLDKAHQKGIVHRDIKPGNILITDDGVVKIIDFGLAKLAGQVKLTKADTTLGTVAYMSPEQAQGEDVDHRTDIWSLGVVLYEMITGRRPFKGEYEQAVVYSIMNEETEPLTGLRTGVPLELERIVNKALAKSPDARYQHVDEMLVDLNSLSSELKTGITKQPTVTTTPVQGKKKTIFTVIAGLFLVALVASYFLFLFKPSSVGRKSIAVLPFKNLSEDKANVYFSDGVTEDIITQISKIGDLKVISRTSVMLYKDSRKSLREIGRELDVAMILEGSVRRADDRVRIVSQLVDARTDEHIWAETYDREMEDIFEIQSDVAQRIAEELKVRLLDEEKEMLEKEPTNNLEAYKLYLQGRFYWNRRTWDDMQRAVEYFEKAVKLDSLYALGYASLAESYVVMGDQAWAAPDSVYPIAEEYCLKALTIDDKLAEAHAALGAVKHQWEWDFAGAEKEYKTAILLKPNYATAYQWLAELYFQIDKFRLSHEAIEKAIELDPYSRIIKTMEGMIYIAEGKYDKAIETEKRVLAENPDFDYARMLLVVAYIGRGAYDEALMQTEQFTRPEYEWVKVIIYSRLGRSNEARAFMQETIPDDLDPGFLAYFYGNLGEVDETFDLYEKAIEQRSPFMRLLKVYSPGDVVKQDPRYEEILRSVGLE